MVNEHASRDSADWPPADDRRPGKKPRLSDQDPSADRDQYAYRGETAEHPAPMPERDYDRRNYDRRPEGPRDMRSDPRDTEAGSSTGPPPPVASPPSPPPPIGARLLLANLSYDTTEEQITDFFRDAGAAVTRVRLVKVTPSNRVNGNAYVWMSDERSMDIALDTDGREFMGRTLRVSAMPEDQRTACVRGLRPRSTPADVQDLFHGCKILDVRCRPVKGGPPDMNTWFVDFADEESFTRALAKDRSVPGLMICIATAQGRGGNRTPRDRQFGSMGAMREEKDHPVRMPPREPLDRRGNMHPGPDNDRPSRSRDGYESRYDDRDYDRRPSSSHDLPDHDRHIPKDRNGMGNGGVPPPPAGRALSRSRSRTPPPSRYDRGGRPRDRYADHDRRDRDDHDRGYGSRSMDRDRRGPSPPPPPRDDRYRDRYDRGGDRDRRSHRRDSDGWGDRDRDRGRDYRRDRDRDYDRDYHRMERRNSGRHDRDGPDSRHADSRDRRDRDRGSYNLDPVVTAVLTNLPFCEDRDNVIDRLGRTLEDLPEDLKVREIIPVGRRCGASIVVFRDEESQNRAVGLQAITISTRKVNILPLEVPSVARVQKLLPGFSVDDILDDMHRHYGVESLFVKHKQSDQVLLGVEDTRYLVRLLDIDGRPLLTSRYATVSYIPSRHYSDSLAGRNRRPPDEYEDPNSRGGGSYRDRGSRDDRGSPGDDRGRGGEPSGSDRRDTGDQPRRGGGDRDSRGYHHSLGEWKVRLSDLPGELGEDRMMAAFAEVGVKDLGLDRISSTEVVIRGGRNGNHEMQKLLSLCRERTGSPFLGSETKGTILYDTKKRSSPDDRAEGKNDRSPKKPKMSPHDDWKNKSSDVAPVSNCSRLFRVSPMTPSPGDYAIPLKVKKQPLDPNLPATCDRLASLRSVIMESGSNEDDEENYMAYCDSLHKMLRPQKLLHTTSNSIDPIPPQVWSGIVKKGASPAQCKGFLVLNSCQKEEEVRRQVGDMPKNVTIERRVHWSHESFTHLLSPKTIVTIIKAGDNGSGDNRSYLAEKEGRGNSSKAVFNGILQSLRGRQNMGLCRYSLPGKKKFVALCIPPNPYVFEKMRVPWRFRDFAGHDSLLLVVGPKNPEG